jgi:hypothetical protein
MSNAFQFRMPAGIPGQVTRASQATVEAQLLDTTYFPTSYGVPVAIDATSHNMRAIKAADVVASVYGMYVRPYPTNSNTDGLGTSTPPVSGIGNCLKRGYISVKLNGATAAAKNGTVYVRTAVGTGSIIGGIEAAADSTNTFALPSNCYFTGPADASGNVEIGFNI